MTAVIATKPPKEKACKNCRTRFVPVRPLQNVCGHLCGLERARKLREAAERKAAAEDRKQTRAELDQRKNLRTLLAEAQTAVNAFIRWRDRDQTCICCGQPFEPEKPGGSVDAGHYLARSMAPHARFNEDNIFAQRKNCNRPGGTTRAAFRAGVIARIGLARVEAVEAPAPVHKWTRDEVRGIRDHYRAKLRDLKKRAGDLST